MSTYEAERKFAAWVVVITITFMLAFTLSLVSFPPKEWVTDYYVDVYRTDTGEVVSTTGPSFVGEAEERLQSILEGLDHRTMGVRIREVEK